MRHDVLWIISAIAALSLFQQHSPTQEKLTIKRPQIATTDLRRATIIGDLGVPIGTLITVEGRYQDMTFTGKKADDGRIELVVDRTNAMRLRTPIHFDFFQGPLFERLKPKGGQRFKLIGFEFGHFMGDVEGAGDYEQLVAKKSDAFGYKSAFAVLKDVERNISERDASICTN